MVDCSTERHWCLVWFPQKIVGSNRAHHLCLKQGSSYLDKADWKTEIKGDKKKHKGYIWLKVKDSIKYYKINIASVKPKVCLKIDSFSSTNM